MSSKVEEEAQSLSVPMCVDYIKIRVGEWTMVMLGETECLCVCVSVRVRVCACACVCV